MTNYPPITAAQVIHWLETPTGLFKGDLKHQLLDDFNLTLEKLLHLETLYADNGRDGIYDYFQTPTED